MECDLGRTRRIFSGGIELYSRWEGNFSPESHHWTGKGAMETPQSKWRNLGIREQYVGGISSSVPRIPRIT